MGVDLNTLLSFQEDPSEQEIGLFLGVVYAAAGIPMQAAVLAVGFALYSLSPALALGCFLYTLISATGSGVLAVVVTQKGGLKV